MRSHGPNYLHAALIFLGGGLIAMAMFCSVNGCASSRLGKALDVAVIGSGSADYLTTQAAIQTGKGREGNALMDHSPLVMGLLKAGGIGAVLAGAALLDSKGFTTWSNVARAAVTILWSGVAAHNLAIARR